MTSIDCDTAEFLHSLQCGSIKKTVKSPDGIVDISSLIEPLRWIRLDAHIARSTEIGGVGQLVALLVDAAAQGETGSPDTDSRSAVVLACFLAHLLRVTHDKFDIAPEELLFQALQDQALTSLTDDMRIAPFYSENQSQSIAWEELRVFAEPLPLERRHLRGFAVRQLGIDTSSEHSVDTFLDRLGATPFDDFPIFDSQDLQCDPLERDEFSWIEDIIDKALDLHPDERDDES